MPILLIWCFRVNSKLIPKHPIIRMGVFKKNDNLWHTLMCGIFWGKFLGVFHKLRGHFSIAKVQNLQKSYDFRDHWIRSKKNYVLDRLDINFLDFGALWFFRFFSKTKILKTAGETFWLHLETWNLVWGSILHIYKLWLVRKLLRLKKNLSPPYWLINYNQI